VGFERLKKTPSNSAIKGTQIRKPSTDLREDGTHRSYAGEMNFPHFSYPVKKKVKMGRGKKREGEAERYRLARVFDRVVLYTRTKERKKQGEPLNENAVSVKGKELLT